MNHKQAHDALFTIFIFGCIASLFYFSLTRDTEIHQLKQELALNKVEAKAICNKRFLGVGE